MQKPSRFAKLKWLNILASQRSIPHDRRRTLPGSATPEKLAS